MVDRTTAGVISCSAAVGMSARTDSGNTGGDLTQFALSLIRRFPVGVRRNCCPASSATMDWIAGPLVRVSRLLVLNVEPEPWNQILKLTSFAVSLSIAKKLSSATTPSSPVSRFETSDPLEAIGLPNGR